MPTATATAGRHNYYNDEDFVRPDLTRGMTRDAVGRRLVRTSTDFLSALRSALKHEVGDAAAEVLYKLGRRWGEADFRAFAERAPREFGVSGLEQMNFNVMLESWRWPLTAAGWGIWRYDFRRARQGLPVVMLTNSAVADSRAKSDGSPACHLYAGLFAAIFSGMTRRDLVGVELECVATGSAECRFLVASTAKATAAAKLRDERLAFDDIMDRLAVPPPAAESPREPG